MHTVGTRLVASVGIHRHGSRQHTPGCIWKRVVTTTVDLARRQGVWMSQQARRCCIIIPGRRTHGW